MRSETKTIIIQIALFCITIITTTLAGYEWITGKTVFFQEEMPGWYDLSQGFRYSFPFLLILTVHEFGHYLMAQWHKVKVTLPYYIPFYFLSAMPSIGTMGAFIRIKSLLRTREQYFDIGAAGPLAGFAVALIVLSIGFTNLPEPEHIFTIHPEYAEYGPDYADHVYKDKDLSIAIGDNLLFWFFKHYIATNPDQVPNPYEIIHYPLLWAGYLALFFTALNLLPLGQLDGGHILYSLMGHERFNKTAPYLYGALLFFSGLGFVSPHEDWSEMGLKHPLYLLFLFFCFGRVFPNIMSRAMAALVIFAGQYALSMWVYGLEPNYTYLLFGMIVGRFLGIYHPPAAFDRPLDFKRKIVGFVSLAVFVVSFTPYPFG